MQYACFENATVHKVNSLKHMKLPKGAEISTQAVPPTYRRTASPSHSMRVCAFFAYIFPLARAGCIFKVTFLIYRADVHVRLLMKDLSRPTGCQ